MMPARFVAAIAGFVGLGATVGGTIGWLLNFDILKAAIVGAIIPAAIIAGLTLWAILMSD